MPASPAFLVSPGRELRASNHRRGRSFEGGLLLREKDDDLALFNELQAREREDFLLQSSDDFEDSFSTKLKHFSDIKIGISIPVRGDTSDLLNVDGEKNDYEWLLTPPDTPLFPSLDDEPPAVTDVSRGRPRSQPISISRSSTMEKSHRSSRGSASPNRLSPSPRSANSVPQSRGRPLSAPHSSPTASLRPVTPSRKPSPPPSKPSTTVPRSSTPTPRRVSTGSIGAASTSGMRGTSPIKTTRGNSSSPKVRAWQTNIPGFSSDAPPNLRVSLADRPASYVRGSSPASRNSRDSGSKFSRQSISPTASRSISSSHTHDRFSSSYGRGSVASSGDDDVDSLQSIPVSGLDHSSTKRVGAISNNKAVAFPKKSPRIVSSSSAPKRSFESAVRQTDNRKSPQNMFRPLLSSVPSTTFYGGKTSAAYRSLISRNSSVTTSSNGSSDQGTSIAPDTEGSDHNQDDIVSECERAPYTDVHEEVFAFDKLDVVNEDFGLELHNKSPDVQHAGIDRTPANQYGLGDHCDSSHLGIPSEVSATPEASHFKGDFLEAASLEDTALCSRCGCRYHVVGPVERDVKLCPECSKEAKLLGVNITKKMTIGPESPTALSSYISEANMPSDQLESLVVVPAQVTDVGESRVSHSDGDVEKDLSSCLGKSQSFSKEHSSLKPELLKEQMDASCHIVGHIVSDSEPELQQLLPQKDYRNSRVDISDGAGISILLKRSSSIKGHVVQGRSFKATTMPYDDLSYARDSQSSFRSSFGHSSFSASSSTDLSSARQIETRVQRQSSGRKSDIENYKYEISVKSQTTSTPSSVISHPVIGLTTSTAEATLEGSAGDLEPVTTAGTPLESQKPEPVSEYAESDVTNASATKMAVIEEDRLHCNDCSRTGATSTAELSRDYNLATPFPNYEDCSSHGNREEFSSNKSVSDKEISVITPESSLAGGHSQLDTDVPGEDVREVPAHSVVSISKIEMEKNFDNFSNSQDEDVSMISKDTLEEYQESSVLIPSDRGLNGSVPDPDASSAVLEESTVMVECQDGTKPRSLTLEEATDAILFCSSIVHDLAYSAATIAMGKESPVELEGSQPTVTILGKSNTERTNLRNRTVEKRGLKPRKPRQKRTETDAKPAFSKTENDENADESAIRNVGIPNKVDSMKQPPKLESKCNCSIM